MIDGRRAALGFLESMEKCVGEMGICRKCANLAHNGDCKDTEEAAGNEKAMKMLRERLSSDPVSSDEDMGDTEEPSSSTSKERKRGGQAGKETIEMYSYTINLVEMADTAEGVASTSHPCGDRTFKKTLEVGCDTIPCYIPKYGDVSDVHLPWAYASTVDPNYFPKGAILEQVDVMQLGKSVNFCVAPFDGAPLCRIGDDRSVFATRDQANQLSHDLCRVLRHKIGSCRGSAFRCDEGGWVDIDAVIDDRNNDIFPPYTTRAKRYMGIMEVIKWQESGSRKSRFQVLAARFPSIMNPNDTRAAREEMAKAGMVRDDIDRIAMDGTDLGEKPAKSSNGPTRSIKKKPAAAALSYHDFLQGLPLRAGMASGKAHYPCLAAAQMAQRPPTKRPREDALLEPERSHQRRRIKLLNKHLLGEEAEVRRLEEQCFAASTDLEEIMSEVSHVSAALQAPGTRSQRAELALRWFEAHDTWSGKRPGPT